MMKQVDASIRFCAVAVAAILVTGTTYALGRYSDAKFAEAVASATSGMQADISPTQTAIAPARVDVVGKRVNRTAA